MLISFCKILIAVSRYKSLIINYLAIFIQLAYCIILVDSSAGIGISWPAMMNLVIFLVAKSLAVSGMRG